MGIILKPFAWLLLFFYNYFGYAVALILFALVVKLILFPLSLKGKKSMIKMNLLSGKMQQLQKQYGRTGNVIRWRSKSCMSGRRSTPWAAACGPCCPCSC